MNYQNILLTQDKVNFRLNKTLNSKIKDFLINQINQHKIKTFFNQEQFKILNNILIGGYNFIK